MTDRKWGSLQLRFPRAISPAVFCFFCGYIWPQDPACGQTPLNQRILVVYSSDSGSRAVARYYMAQRGIPERNGCRIAVDSATAVNQDDFERRVKGPVRKCLETAGKQKILYIVFS